MRHVLVVANRTLGGEELLRVVTEKAAAEDTDFWIVVPATHLTSVRSSQLTDGVVGAQLDFGGARMADEDRVSYDAARARLSLGIERLTEAGLDVGGEVGNPDPRRAVEETLTRREADEIIVSTLPTGASHWLRMGLPQRLARKHHLPVTTVTARVASPAT